MDLSLPGRYAEVLGLYPSRLGENRNVFSGLCFVAVDTEELAVLITAQSFQILRVER